MTSGIRRCGPTRFLVLMLLVTSPMRAQACGDLTVFDGVVQNAVNTLGLRGAGVRLEQGGALVRETYFGTYTATTVVPIASATKWLSAAVLMALADEGKLDLDDRVVDWLPAYSGAKAAITLRQCFTHTSGLPASHPAISDKSLTLQQAAAQIATAPLLYTPGTAFSYGGVSMHVAGAVCELAAGKPWAQIFQEKVAGPLGMSGTDYDAFGQTANPRIAGGAQSTLRDYARFADMLRAGGAPVLTPGAVAEMFKDHTSWLPVLVTPHPYGAPYGIGTWLDRLDTQGRPLLVSGAGAFGFSAWVDLERGAAGTFLVLDRYSRIWPYVGQMQAAAADALAPFAVSCVGQATPACGPLWANANGLPEAGAAGFGLISLGAPASSAGALILALAADPLGTPALGITLHVALAPPPVVLPVGSDPTGRAQTPLPLAGTSAGQRFAAQYVWIGTASCGGLGRLAATQALDIALLGLADRSNARG